MSCQVVLCDANFLYLSFEAFNSRTASLKEGPSKVRARHKMLVVFPVPGGPLKKKKKKTNKQ